MQTEMDFGVDQAAVDRVTVQLIGIGRLGVAFSGGVDSATLLALAVRALGPDRVVAVVGVSPSLAADERTAAHDVARHIGVPLVEVATHEDNLPAYRANGPDRCFHCKNALFQTITDGVLKQHGLDRIAYGENATTCAGPIGREPERRPDTACCGPSPTRVSTRPRYGASRGCSACRVPTNPRPPAWPPGSRTTSP